MNICDSAWLGTYLGFAAFIILTVSMILLIGLPILAFLAWRADAKAWKAEQDLRR